MFIRNYGISLCLVIPLKGGNRLRLRNHSLGADNTFEERAYGEVCYLRNTENGLSFW